MKTKLEGAARVAAAPLIQSLARGTSQECLRSRVLDFAVSSYLKRRLEAYETVYCIWSGSSCAHVLFVQCYSQPVPRAAAAASPAPIAIRITFGEKQERETDYSGDHHAQRRSSH